MLTEELLSFLGRIYDESDLNRLHEDYGGDKIFSYPLIGVAAGNDPIFQTFKEVVGKGHLTPFEMWNINSLKSIKASYLRVVSIIFPYGNKIRDESHNIIKLKHVTLPAEVYSIGRNYANDFKKQVLRKSVDFIHSRGFEIVAPMITDSFTVLTNQELHSNWSERHIAFAAGLGTFSHHDGLITEVGCNIRLASFITNAPFTITTRIHEDPYGNCLYRAKGICRECERRCPANAITENGHDKNLCYYYGRKIARKMLIRIGDILKPHVRRVDGKLRDPSYPVGCAFCQFGVPCMDKNPMRGESRDL